MSPDNTDDHHKDHQQKEPDHTATPPSLPQPGDIYAKLFRTLAEPMDAEQYYQQVLQDLPATHVTLQVSKQEKGGDNERSPEDDLTSEDTYGSPEGFLEDTPSTYPRPPMETRRGLHVLLAFQTRKHHHAITLHLSTSRTQTTRLVTSSPGAIQNHGYRHLPRDCAVHNGTLQWDKITAGVQAVSLHWVTEPTDTWILPANRHYLLLSVQGDATIAPKRGPLPGRHNSGDPCPYHPHAPTRIVNTHDGTPRPQPMANHRHHLPPPQTTAHTPGNTGGKTSAETSSRST